MCFSSHLGKQQNYKLNFRGFSSHLGYWTGHEDYYDHTAQELYQPVVNICFSMMDLGPILFVVIICTNWEGLLFWAFVYLGCHSLCILMGGLEHIILKITSW